MGLRTEFKLKVIGKDESGIDHQKEISKLSDYNDCFDEEIKWYDCEIDMREYSKRFPDLVFVLNRKDDMFTLVWDNYFKNGKMQDYGCMRPVFAEDVEPYDENKLI